MTTTRNDTNQQRPLFAVLLCAGLLLIAMTIPVAASSGIAVSLLPEDAAGGDAAVKASLPADSQNLLPENTGEDSEPDETSIIEPPFPPEMPVPPSGATDVSADTVLRWSAEDSGQYPVRYAISLGSAGLPADPVAQDLEEPEYDPQNLTPGVTYAWQVTATDGDMYLCSG